MAVSTIVSTGTSVPLPIGAINSTMQPIVSNTDERSIQGLALPARVLVRSISWPTNRLPATMSMVEISGNSDRNVPTGEPAAKPIIAFCVSTPSFMTVSYPTTVV